MKRPAMEMTLCTLVLSALSGEAKVPTIITEITRTKPSGIRNFSGICSPAAAKVWFQE
jgi:hypothetical protein